ncbi:hypothetical protein [Marinobacter alkaliphilus]|uniref:Uncharacterized protein n=1 Tax=Marinobacter alkaliphilus TaxID=254719 RepID=A0ABZ3E7U5_9GAMM
MAGDYIFLKFADRDVSVVITDGMGTQKPVVMAIGDKYRPGPFKQFAITNTDNENPAQVVLTVGNGDYSRQIIQGEVQTIAGVRRADGTLAPDTRYDICIPLQVIDDEKQEVQPGDVFKDIGMEPWTDDSQSSMWVRNGIVYRYYRNAMGPALIYMYDAETLQRIGEGQQVNNVESNTVVYNPVTDELYAIGDVLPGTFGHMYRMPAGEVFTASWKSAGWQADSGVVADRLSVSPGGQLELFYDLGSDTIGVKRYTTGGVLTVEKNLETRVALVFGLIHFNGVTATLQRDYKWYLRDSETLEIISEWLDVPAIFSHQIGTLGAWDNVNQCIIEQRNGSNKRYAITSYVINGRMVTGVQNANLIRKAGNLNITGATLRQLATGRHSLSGEVVKALLRQHYLETEGKTIGDNYLDHVFGIKTDTGLQRESGANSFKKVGISDSFDVTLPATIRITVDNEMPRA